MFILWIAAYGLVYTAAGRLQQNVHPWVVPLAMAGYAAALIGWIFRTGRAQFLGLCAARKGKISSFYRFLPLLILPVCNLLTAKTFFPGLPVFFLMLSVCAAEEIFFRGFLLRSLMQYGALPAIVLSSGIFALFHLVNLMSGGLPAYTWMQVLCAFSVGICYGAITIQTGSLIPCFFAHFLTNITAAPVSTGAVPWFWLCIAAYVLCGIHLCKELASGTS